MRIISKKNDYYDGYMNHDKKDVFNKIWIREEHEIGINKNLLTIFEEKTKFLSIYTSSYKNYLIRPIFIVIAGKVFPLIEVYKFPCVSGCFEYVNEKYEYYHDFKSFKKEYSNFLKKGYDNKEAKYNDFFNSYYPDMTKINLFARSPIILIEPKKKYYKKEYSSIRKIYFDINLKKYGFSKKFNASQMYQRLDNFVSNIMINDNMPVYPRKDIDKIISHGFDIVWSFRKKGNK